MGEEGFRWFLGVVEDINDPKKLGRVKVRVRHEQDEGIETDDMDWAHVMLPNTSESVGGVGDTPSLMEGSNVIGFYLDSQEKQLAMIIGVYPIIPEMDDDKHSISYLARGKQTLTKENIGPEPDSAYSAEYPYNRVITTRSGHAIELDDTPEHERIHIYHKSGSYIEIDAKGRVVHKAAAESIDVTSTTKTLYTGEDLDIQSARSITLGARRGIKMAAAGGVVVTEGSVFVKGSLGSGVGATGSFTTPTGQIVHVQNGIVTSID